MTLRFLSQSQYLLFHLISNCWANANFHFFKLLMLLIFVHGVVGKLKAMWFLLFITLFFSGHLATVCMIRSRIDLTKTQGHLLMLWEKGFYTGFRLEIANYLQGRRDLPKLMDCLNVLTDSSYHTTNFNLRKINWSHF